MYDALLVCGLERVGDLLRDRQGLIERYRTFRDEICERRPFDKFQHERVCAARIFEAVDCCDVSMIKGCQNLCFSFETRKAFRVECEAIRQNLQRDITIEL